MASRRGRGADLKRVREDQVPSPAFVAANPPILKPVDRQSTTVDLDGDEADFNARLLRALSNMKPMTREARDVALETCPEQEISGGVDYEPSDG